MCVMTWNIYLYELCYIPSFQQSSLCVFCLLYLIAIHMTYEGVSKSLWTGCLEQELQMVQLSAMRCSCLSILWVSLVSFAIITLCVASQQVFIVVILYFIIDSVQKLLETPL